MFRVRSLLNVLFIVVLYQTKLLFIKISLIVELTGSSFKHSLVYWNRVRLTLCQTKQFSGPGRHKKKSFLSAFLKQLLKIRPLLAAIVIFLGGQSKFINFHQQEVNANCSSSYTTKTSKKINSNLLLKKLLHFLMIKFFFFF